MKKTLLLMAALFAGAFTVSAQDAVEPVEPTPYVQRDEVKPQSIPGDLTLGDCKITVMQGETPAKIVYAAPGEDSKWEGATLGNTNNNYTIEYTVTSTEASYYIITFMTGSKNNGSSLDLELFNGTTSVWKGTMQVPNNGQWSGRNWANPYCIVDEEIPAGTYNFVITCKQEDPAMNVVNIAGINFAARAEVPETTELYTACTLMTASGEEDGTDAGSIVVSPAMDQYISGTEITLTARANTGYKFLYFVNNAVPETQITENPYKFNIGSDANDFSAYFEELDMMNAIPGTMSLDKAYDVVGYASGKNWNVTKEGCKVFPVGSEEFTRETVQYFSDMRNPSSACFKVDVKQAGSYVLTFGAAAKDGGSSITFTLTDADDNTKSVTVGPFAEETDYPKAGGWTDFHMTQSTPFTLTAGQKVLKLDFKGTKNTVNIANINFALEGSSGIDNIVVGEDEINGEVKAYNLQGIEVAPDTKGLIIINGKKVYNK